MMIHHQMKTIRSELHQTSSYQLNKVSLSPFDDKRYILNDGITSYAYDNYMKPEEVEKKKRLDNSAISLKAFNTILGVKGKKRELERRDKRAENTKLSKEASKTAAARLQKKLIERGKKRNLGPNFFAYN